jgi:hypothetical protein
MEEQEGRKMASIGHSIEIEAEAAQVWNVVTDLAGYASWNPFMVEAEGELVAGRPLRVRMHVGNRTMSFSPTVQEVDEGRRVRWLGRLGLPGIFDGEHVLAVEAIGAGRTRFTQHEQFRGILVPFLRSLLRSTSEGFQAMNEALKARVETAA